MAVAFLQRARVASGFKAFRDLVHLRTDRAFQFVDVTELIDERIRRSRVESGLASIQVLHTTAALAVNENEELLLNDMQLLLERMAPRSASYAHDDLERRGLSRSCAEPGNGHAHCKALFLSPAVVLNVASGRLVLGRWQRVFLVELDGGQQRSISIVALGTAAGDVDENPYASAGA